MTLGDLHYKLEDLIMRGHEDLEIMFDEGALLLTIDSVAVEEYYDNKGGTILRVVVKE